MSINHHIFGSNLLTSRLHFKTLHQDEKARIFKLNRMKRGGTLYGIPFFAGRNWLDINSAIPLF